MKKKWAKFDKEKWSDYLKIGQLKKIIADMPDDAFVFMQRIEDVYFEKHGWEGLRRPNEDNPEDSEGNEYVNVWYAMRFKDIDEHLYLTPHF